MVFRYPKQILNHYIKYLALWSFWSNLIRVSAPLDRTVFSWGSRSSGYGNLFILTLSSMTEPQNTLGNVEQMREWTDGYASALSPLGNCPSIWPWGHSFLLLVLLCNKMWMTPPARCQGTSLDLNLSLHSTPWLQGLISVVVYQGHTSIMIKVWIPTWWCCQIS